MYFLSVESIIRAPAREGICTLLNLLSPDFYAFMGNFKTTVSDETTRNIQNLLQNSQGLRACNLRRFNKDSLRIKCYTEYSTLDVFFFLLYKCILFVNRHKMQNCGEHA